MDTITECDVLVKGIRKKLGENRGRLREIEVEVARLEKLGVYDAVPSESWESRNGGEKRYLRLVFPVDGAGRAKEYVGADPDKVEDAREKTRRTRMLLGLEAEARRIGARAILARATLLKVLKNLDGISVW